MRTLPVHWHEGMFLRPHHFQAADRYWADQLRQASRYDLSYNWGVRQVDVDTAALKNFRFVVNRLQARLRDGTIVRVPQDAAIRELDLHGAFQGAADTCEVMLAVPTLEVGRANVGGGADDGSRYTPEAPKEGVPDENTGQNNRPVQFRRLNLALLVSGQDTAGYETLTIARLRRSTQGETLPQLDSTFIPAALAIDAFPALKQDVLQQIYYKIGQLVRQLGEVVKGRGITFLDTDAEARQMFEALRLLNGGAAVSRMLARTDGLHPVTAYLELCRLVGQFAVFGQDPSCPELPDYDHDDLGRCFFEVKRILDHLLNATLFDLKFQQRPFQGSGLQMRVEMDEPWLATGWQMFVGVESNLASSEVILLLTSGAMNMKIASSDRVEEVFSRGHRGMVFRHEPQPPRVLPQSKTTSYFSIERTPDEWPFVQKTRKVAIRLNDKLLDGDLEGKRDVLIRGTPGKQPVLRFTLYIVPPKG